MTTENGTALATRAADVDKHLRTRMQANINARFGLHEATPAQLNVVFLLARRWGLDPVNEITLYEGRPFITLDGRLQLMRRHPDFNGYRTRALTRDEKEAWGYEPDDLVVECTVRTHGHGEIVARGCVRRQEIIGAQRRSQESGKRAAPIGIYGPEIAEKRAIARASRAAFGQDVPDETEAGYVIEERDSSENVRMLAARATEIFGSDEDGTAFADQPKQPTVPKEAGVLVKSVQHKAYQTLAERIEQLALCGIDTESYVLAVPAPLSEFEARIARAEAAISDYQDQQTEATTEPF